MKKIFYLVPVILLIIIWLVTSLLLSQKNKKTWNTVSGTTESSTIKVSTRPAANIK